MHTFGIMHIETVPNMVNDEHQAVTCSIQHCSLVGMSIYCSLINMEVCFIRSFESMVYCPADFLTLNSSITDCEVYDGVNGVHLVLTRDSRSSGDAFVEFPTEKDLQRGLQKHRQHLGSRYVEGLTIFIFLS